MTEIEERNHKLAELNFSRVSKLTAAEEFRWFLRECVQREMDAQDGRAKDEKLTPAERENAVAKWNALRTVREWPDSMLSTTGRTLGHEPKTPLDISSPETAPEK